MGIGQWLRKLFNGPEGKSTTPVAWGQAIRGDRIDSIDGGYLTITARAHYLNFSNYGIAQGIPLIIASTRFNNRYAAVQSEYLEITKVDAATEIRNGDLRLSSYVLADVILVAMEPTSNTTIEITAALKWHETQNLFSEALTLVQKVTSKLNLQAQTATDAAASAISFVQQLLTLGKTPYGVIADDDLSTGNLTNWVAYVSPPKNTAAGFKIEHLRANSDISDLVDKNNQPYRESSFILLRFDYNDLNLDDTAAFSEIKSYVIKKLRTISDQISNTEDIKKNKGDLQALFTMLRIDIEEMANARTELLQADREKIVQRMKNFIEGIKNEIQQFSIEQEAGRKEIIGPNSSAPTESLPVAEMIDSFIYKTKQLSLK